MQLSKRFIKKYLFFVCFIGCTTLVFSQNTTKNDSTQTKNSRRFIDDVNFGGGLGLNFSNNFFACQFSPTAVYNINNSVGLGVGYNLMVNSLKGQYSSVINGGRILSLINVGSVVQASMEYEQNYVNINLKTSGVPNKKFWTPALFLGLGYRTGNVIIGMRYNVLYNEEKSIYASPYIPFFRVFF